MRVFFWPGLCVVGTACTVPTADPFAPRVVQGADLLRKLRILNELKLGGVSDFALRRPTADELGALIIPPPAGEPALLLGFNTGAGSALWLHYQIRTCSGEVALAELRPAEPALAARIVEWKLQAVLAGYSARGDGAMAVVPNGADGEQELLVGYGHRGVAVRAARSRPLRLMALFGS